MDASWLLAIALVVITILAYEPVWHAGFIWDDNLNITENPMVMANDGLHRFWFTTEAFDYYPVTSSLWWLEWRVWGRGATGYHVINVLLHAINAVLVWIILRRLRVPGAWLTALVFAIHPVNVATVAWISELKNTLSMLFYAVAILLYLRFDEEGRWSWYGLSLAAFLLALLSKTAVVMLPIVLLGCVWWLRGRLQWKDLLRIGPFVVLSLVLGGVTMWLHPRRALAVGGLSEPLAGVFSRVAVVGDALWFYLYKAILPWNLCAIYPKWNINASRWISYVPTLALLGCLTLFWWRRKSWGRPLLFGLGYLVAMLFPVLGFFHISFYEYSFVADHWQYHAMIGVIALAVATGVTICRRMGERGQFVGMVASISVLTMLGVATWTRASVYAESETLWRDNVAKYPGACVAHENLATALFKAGSVQEAVGHWEQALQIKPDFAKAHSNLGVALWRMDRVPEAIEHLEEALRIQPNFADAHYNLGCILSRLGRTEEAIGQYEQAIRIDPNFTTAQNNLGAVLMRLNRAQEAIRHYEEALRIRPDYAEAHVNLGFALAQEGKLDEAVQHWETALRLDPGNQNAQRGLERMRSIRSSNAATPQRPEDW